MAPLNGMLSTKVRYGQIDRSGEQCAINVHLAPIEDDGSNIDDLFANLTGEADLLKAAFIALGDCNFTRTTFSGTAETSAGGLPSEEDAQRESRYRVFYTDDTTGKKYHFDIPGADLSLLGAGTDVLDLAGLAIAPAVALIEAHVVSELGNPISVTKIQYVGVNA